LFFVTMNLDTWNSIPEDLQKIVTETTEKFYDEVGIGLWDMQNEVGIKFAVDEQGMEVIELTDAEKAIWIEKVIPIQRDFETSLKDQGIDDDILSVVKRLSDKYNDIYK